MFYRANWHAATKRVLLESGDVSAPAAISGGGFADAGTFEHEAADDTLTGMQEHDDNHVLYHHVQEIMYKRGEQNMQAVAIFVDAPRAISIGSGTISIAVAATSQLTVTPTPANAVKDVIYTSSDPTKATVNADGLITGVAAGSAVITAKLRANETITATRNVTVTA